MHASWKWGQLRLHLHRLIAGNQRPEVEIARNEETSTHFISWRTATRILVGKTILEAPEYIPEYSHYKVRFHYTHYFNMTIFGTESELNTSQLSRVLEKQQQKLHDIKQNFEMIPPLILSKGHYKLYIILAITVVIFGTIVTGAVAWYFLFNKRNEVIFKGINQLTQNEKLEESSTPKMKNLIMNVL